MNETKKELYVTPKPNVERSILSICLQMPDKIIEVKAKEVKGDMFMIEANKYIFYSIDYLYSKKQTPNPILVYEVLKDQKARKTVEEFGGIDYLNILAEQRITPDSLDFLCEKLKQNYTRQRIIEVCQDSILTLSSDDAENIDIPDLIHKVEEPLNDLTLSVQQTEEIYKMGTRIEDVLEERADNPNSVPGLEVGWNKVDYYTGGGRPGNLIMVCARAKTGKSTLLTNWATSLSIQDKIPVLYFDTEMSSREQEDRILSILSGVPEREIEAGTFVVDTENGKAKDKIEKIKNGVKMMKEGKYFHIYMPSYNIEKVVAISKKFKIQEDIQAIFFDYLKVPASSAKSFKSVAEWQLFGFLAQELKDLAGQLKIPIWSACQENRAEVVGGKKDARNIGGSDRILQNVSTLMFLSNKSEEEIFKEGGARGNQTLDIAYQRNGESDVPPIDIMFHRETLTQKEV